MVAMIFEFCSITTSRRSMSTWRRPPRCASASPTTVADFSRTPLVQRLDQETPGQLGKIARSMADAGVDIEVMYSDHDHQLILVVDDHDAGAAVSAAWAQRAAS